MPSARRNTITYVDHWIVAGVAVVSAVIAVLAGCEPTGSTPVDVVLVALTAAFVTWIGASAPWWALIVASGGAGLFAAAGGSILLSVVAWVALGVALWIAATRSNQPVLRSVITGVSVQVVFRLEWDPFFLAPTIVGVVLLGVLVACSVRRRPKHVRRPLYWAGAALAVLAVLATAGFGIAFAQVRTETSSGYGLMLEGLDFVQDGQTRRGADLLRDAAEDLSTASDGLASPLAQPARLVPGVAQNRNASAEVLASAAEAARAASETLYQVDIDQLRIVDGVVDLLAFDVLVGPLTELESTIVDLRAVLDEHRSDWLVPPLQDRLDRAEARAVQIERQTTGTATLARLGPGLLGADGPRRYFIAFVNSAEARATGGLMGNWAEITVDAGRITRSANGRTAELQRGVTENSPVILDQEPEFFDRFGYLGLGAVDRGAGANGWVNIGISADLPTVGSVYTQLYEGATGRAVDGVLIIDPAGLAALLAVTGPIELPELDLRLTADNTEQFLLVDQYQFDEADREDLLEAVSEATVNRLLGTTLPPPHQMARALADPALHGHLGVYAVRVEEQQFFTDVGIDGALPRWGTEVLSDVLAVTVNNSSGNKIESFLERRVEYRPVHDPDTGEVTAELRVTLRNDAPTTGFPDYVIGNIVGLPVGTNRLLLEVYSPLGIGDLFVDGVLAPGSGSREQGLNVTTIGVEIPPGATVEVTGTLTGRVAPGWYSLVYRPQALPRGDALFVDGRSGGRTIAYDAPIARRSVIDSLGVRAWR